MASFRNGQWVKFLPQEPIARAHTLPDGKVCGIFVRGGTDGTGQAFDDMVNVVDVKGCNIPMIKDDGTITNVSFAPSEVPGLEPILDVDHIPGSRRATMREGFTPRA